MLIPELPGALRLDLELLAPLMLAIGLPVLAASILGTAGTAARLALLLPTVGFGLAYMHWRWTTPLPEEGGLAQAIWAGGFLGIETLATISSLLTTVFLMRPRDRRAVADAGLPQALRDAPVDVFICTYNEGYEILERTILCATRIAHRDLRVWVLDDGGRDWVETLALELGALYLTRSDRSHAKAGNVNNGLRHALRTGRPPEFVLLLDADFAAHRNILRRALPLMADPTVGVVQTPQHFYNPDPVQSGLLAAHAWPDEQRFFFSDLMPGLDGWGAAFCCGTSAVLRARAMVEAGGMATESVTEDVLTTFRLIERGWRTVYLNERLSAGLAPEGLGEYVTQRSRWCLGGIQQIYTRWSFWGPGRIPLMCRLSQLCTVLYWSCSFPARLLALAAPAVFWWTGLLVMQTDVDGLMTHLAPWLASSLIALGLASRWRIAPLLSDVAQLLVAIPIMTTVAQALVRPFGRPFRVTPKGLSRDGTTVHWGLLAPFATLAALTVAGMLQHVSDWSPGREDEGFALVIVWAMLSLLLLGLVIACCVEPPRPRKEERFATDEAALVCFPDGGRWFTRLRDLSTRGASVSAEGIEQAPRQGEIWLDGGDIRLRFRVVRFTRGGMAIRFHPDTVARRALVVKLYTGDYVNQTDETALMPALRASIRRVFA